MNEKFERVAYAAGSDRDVVEKLDQVLSGENDRAFLICAFDDCVNNTDGRCTIFAIKDVPKMKRTVPCDKYEARYQENPST